MRCYSRLSHVSRRSRDCISANLQLKPNLTPRQLNAKPMRAKIVPALTLNRLLGVAWAIVLGFLFVLAIDSFTATFSVEILAVFVYVAKGILQGEDSLSSSLGSTKAH